MAAAPVTVPDSLWPGISGASVAGFSDPVQLFHKLFSADELPLEERQAAIAKNRSVLDAVLAEAKRVHAV